MEPPKKSSVLSVVFFTIFLDLVGFGIIIPIQPFLAEQFGATPRVVTLLGASYSLMQFLFAPFWGRLSDRIGRRPVMLSSIAFGTVGYFLFGWAGSLFWLFVARILSGFGNANLGAAQAIIADATTPQERAKGMGIIGAAFGLGFIFGPALGGIFSHFGLSVPAYVAGALSLLNLVLAYFRLPETHVRGRAAPAAHRGNARLGLSIADLRHATSLPRVPQLLVVFFFATMGFSMMEQVIGLFVERTWLPNGVGIEHAHEAARLTAYILVTVGVTATIVQGGLIGWLAPRFGERRLLMAGQWLNALSFASLAFIGGFGFFAVMIPFSFLTAVGSGLSNPSLTSLLSKLVDDRERGAVLGLGQSLSALGRVFGPALAGVLFEMKPSMPFTAGALLMAGSALLVQRLPKSING